MALPTVPEWLKIREGALKPGLAERIVFVIFSGQPQYRLEARPAMGKFECAITQTINGKRLDDSTTYPSIDAALVGGLEQLRAKLGW